METIKGNADANGSLDKAEPYMKETYPQRRLRIERELACRAADQVIIPAAKAQVFPVRRMPGNGSFA